MVSVQDDPIDEGRKKSQIFQCINYPPEMNVPCLLKKGPLLVQEMAGLNHFPMVFSGIFVVSFREGMTIGG